MPPWERVVITPDLWPDEVIDDITAWYEDLRGTWPDEELCGSAGFMEHRPRPGIPFYTK